MIINIALLGLILHGMAELYLHKARALSEAFAELAKGREAANEARGRVVRAVLHELAGPLTVLEFCANDLAGEAPGAELADRVEAMLARMRASLGSLEHLMREELS
jgi:signal transduction histidine kinase